MSFQKITAIISLTSVDKVCQALKHAGVTWVTVSQQRGHGENPILSERHCLSNCVHVEIFIEKEKTMEIVDLLGHAAYEGEESEGMIAIETIDDFFPIREFKNKQ